MSDVLCVVCGEPWDFYGARHGDMESWEYRLFKLGAGCPSCEGKSEGPGFDPESIISFENGDDDEMDRIIAYEAHMCGTAPKWLQPEEVCIKRS